MNRLPAVLMSSLNGFISNYQFVIDGDRSTSTTLDFLPGATPGASPRLLNQLEGHLFHLLPDRVPR